MTSRWAVDVAPHRDLELVWRPISLLFKNDTQPDSAWYEPVKYTHDLLRVLESVRAAEGDGPIGRFYEVAGEHIHQRSSRPAAAALLAEAGLDVAHAAAADDPAWDVVIRAGMDEGLALVGNDVGTPIISFDGPAGERVGFFGPVISRRLPLDASLRLWDGMMLMGTVPSFWELKRSRTEGPDFSPPA